MQSLKIIKHMTFVKRNAIYDEISARIKIRSRCNWCEFEEKSNFVKI